MRFGLAQFRQSGSSNDPNGGYVLVPVNDYKWDDDSNPATPEVDFSYSLNGITKTQGNHLKDAITSLDGETWTPLGESMFQLYTYFMSRDPSQLRTGVSSPRAAQVRCPSDAELALAISAAAHREAAARAETCFARKYSDVGDWRAVR